MKIKFIKKGFTLAEIMIVLSVIGVITAILLPIARHATPDENILKLKKANATLGNVIRELAASDKYFLDGNFAKYPNGDRIYESDYFCKAFADIVSVERTACYNKVNTYERYWQESEIAEQELSQECYTEAKLENSPYIKTSDGIYYYLPYALAFGDDRCDMDEINGIRGRIAELEDRKKLPTETEQDIVLINEEIEQLNKELEKLQGCFLTKNSDGFYYRYMPFCVDIDGDIDNDQQCDDIKDICPFGYGIRVDGKISPDKRTLLRLEKGIQNKD